MDPALMVRFVALMEKARAVLDEEIPAILAELSKVDGDRGRMLRSRDVANWADQEVPNLRRREQLIRTAAALPAWTPGGAQGLRPFDERRFVSVAEARRQGADLARRISGTRPGDLGFGLKYTDDEYAAFAGELAARRHDPDFTAAFFAELGVEGSLRLGERFRYAMHDADKAIDTISEAFGTAVRSGGGTAARPGDGLRAFTEIVERITAGPVKDAPGDVSPIPGLGDLLRAGEFPSDWLAAVATRHVLAPRSTENGEQLAGFLHALGNDPVAARAFIAAGTRDASLETFLRGLNERVEVTSSHSGQEHLQAKENSRADAFGRMLAAAAGAYDEKDGAHSEEAARVAFDLLTTLPKLDVKNPRVFSANLQEPTRIHLAEIAAAYATEITEGADLSDANRTKPSEFGPVATIVPGLSPAFRLSPADTFAFVKTFANSPANVKPFEKGMGELADRLVSASVGKDAAQSIERLERAMRALGHVSGMQFAAERQVQGDLDAQDQEQRKRQAFALGLGLGIAGIPVPLEGQALWLALGTGTPIAFDKLTENGKTRLQALDDKARLAGLARGHWLVNTLAESGFKAKVPPTDARFSQPPITGQDGRLLPFEQIAKDKEALRNLNDWLIANGSGGTSKHELGEAAKWLDEIVFGGARTASAQNPAPY